MSFLESKTKGEIPVGATVAGSPGFSVLKATADGQVLISDSTVNEGWRPVSSNDLVDPRLMMRFAEVHNVGVTGGG